MGTILLNFLFQVISVVLIFYFFGFLLWVLNRLFYKMLGRAALKVCIGTGIIGTPIHELGHAFFCVVFFHKITEMRLFKLNTDDGVLGYVSHSYNRKNVYQQIGNFFIGIGPIVFGSAVLYLLMFLLVPDTFSALWQNSVNASPENIFATLWQMIKTIFAGGNFANWRWWVFMLLAILITLHMTLSPADVKGSLIGMLFILIIILLLNVLLYFVAPVFQGKMTDWLFNFAMSVASLLAFAVLVALIIDLITFVVKMIVNAVKK